MADLKITQLDELTAPVGTGIIPIVNDPIGGPVTKKVTVQNLRKLKAEPPDDLKISGTIITLTANEDQTLGDACYINADGEAQIGDASIIATASAVVMCADDTIDADAPGNYILFGIVRQDEWNWTPGGLIYLTITGTTTNTLSQTPPSDTDEVIQILGVATHADRMLFKPSLVQVEHA